MSVIAKILGYTLWLCAIAWGGIYTIQARTDCYISWTNLHPASLQKETLGDPFVALLIGYGAIVITVVLLLTLPIWAHFSNRTKQNLTTEAK